MFLRRAAKIETAPEKTTLAINNDGSSSELVISPALSPSRRKAFWSAMHEVVDRGLVRCSSLPNFASHTYNSQSTSSRFRFSISHFGSFSNTQAEIGLIVAHGILEEDGAVFDMDNMGDSLKAVITPASGVQETAVV